MKKEKSLQISKTTQVKVVEELVESSRLTFDFYLMLILSSVVVTLGLLMNNIAVIIGGMLITPLLTPLLTLALGMVISDSLVMRRSIKIIFISTGIVIGVSFVVALLLPHSTMNDEIYSRLNINLPYLLVAFVAGLAATFAWSKKNLSAMMPGVAIAVSLLPPISVLGIGIARLSGEMIRGSLASFLFNLFGVVIGSAVIFSLLNFSKSKKETEKAIKKEIKEEEQIKQEKIEKEIKKEIKKEKEEEKIIKKVIEEEEKKEIKLAKEEESK
jgi:uncharacterized hydrophobic protein (TIGR00341 family)